MTSTNLWIGSFHERRPLNELDDALDHIHGEFGISIDGRPVPSLGYFGPDDVCLNAWLHEIWMVYGRLSADVKARCEFDEGEQGQPCFRFERDDKNLFVSVVEGSGGGLANPQWQRVKAPLDGFRQEVVRFTESIRNTVIDAASEPGREWFNDHVDPALADAYQRRSLVALQALLSAGVRPDASDASWTGSRVVDLAISDGEHETVELLARYGADLDLTDRDGLSALHRSARSKDQHPTIKTLLNCGANILAADNHGWTALHHAATYGYLANVELLLAHGADREARTADGLTASDLASANNHLATIKALETEMP